MYMGQASGNERQLYSIDYKCDVDSDMDTHATNCHRCHDLFDIIYGGREKSLLWKQLSV